MSRYVAENWYLKGMILRHVANRRCYRNTNEG